MDKIPSFEQFVLLKEGNTRSALKTLLYPLGYGGLGNYPPLHFIPQAADAILYISKDERLFCNGDGPPWDISHLPGHKQYGDKINNGEGEPYDIRDLPGKIIEPKPTDVPGKVVAPRGFVRLIQKVKCLKEKPQRWIPD
jgi:hypothetical protein